MESTDGSRVRDAVWDSLKKATSQFPALWVLVAVAVPLIGASAVVLAPFILPLAVMAVILMKSDTKKEVRTPSLSLTHTHG